MAKVSKSILLAYNKCSELATKYSNILDSFWHKDEKIPLASLESNPKTYVASGSESVSVTGVGSEEEPYAVSVSDLGYKTVSTIPEYLLPDGVTVIENEDDYSIIDVHKLTELPLTLFGAKADLEYIDISFTSGNQITCVAKPFTTDDIGKLIAIKDTHHNPNTITGTEYPNSSLGRIVTVTAEILDVVTGVATIDFTCNLTADARAYKYTNNFDAVQQAMNFASAFEVNTVVRNGVGVYGVNPLKSKLYESRVALIHEQTSSLVIKGTDDNPFKLCTEDVDISESFLSLYVLRVGNFDFTHIGKVIPPDRGCKTTMGNTIAILSTRINGNYAQNSVRTITLSSIHFDKSDMDGNDGWFTSLYESSKGGVDDLNRQVVYLENLDCNIKSGGLSSFSQNGNTNTIHNKNINLQRWGNHYAGEQGREEYPTPTIENMAENNCEWIFNHPFTVLDGILTINDLSLDFSFFDTSIQANKGSRGYSLYFESDGYSAGYFITNINSPKSLSINSISNGSYSGKWKIKSTKDYYGHPVYYHPNQNMTFENVISDKNLFWLNSSGGAPNPFGSSIFIKNSEINTMGCTNGLNDYGTNITIIDSTVGFNTVAKFNDFKAINSLLSGWGSCNYLKQLDNCSANYWGFHIRYTKILEINNFRSSGTAQWFEQDDLVLTINGLSPARDYESSSRSVFLPYGSGENSVITINNCFISEEDEDLRVYFNYPVKDLTYLLNNFKSFYYSNGAGGKFFDYIDFSTEKVQFYFSDFFFNAGDRASGNPDPLFEPTSIYNGMFDIPLKKVTGDKGYKFNPIFSTSLEPFIFYDQTGLFINGLINNKHIITESNVSFNQINLWLNSENSHTTVPVKGSLIGGNSLFSGEFELTFINGSSLDFTPSMSGISASNRLRHATNLSNVVFKSLKRVDGEKVIFRVDSKQARVVEVSSSVEKKYEDEKPTRSGIENEKIYLTSTSVFWQYMMQFTKLTNEVYTIVSDGVETIIGTSTGIPSDADIVRYAVNTGVSNLSILQEKSDGTPYELFSFSLILDDNTELIFTPRNTGYIVQVANDINKNYVLNWWLFEDSTNTYKCHIDNLIGRIVFEDDTVPFTLKATDNFKINNGYQITDANWVRGNENEEELVTTATRTAIFAECRLGYRVYDTDTLTHYTRGAYDWVAGETEVAP